MAKKQKPQSNGDRHKPRYMVGLPARLVEQLDLICDRNCTDRTAEVVRAVRLMLEAEGLWPPQATDDEDADCRQNEPQEEEKPKPKRKRNGGAS